MDSITKDAGNLLAQPGSTRAMPPAGKAYRPDIDGLRAIAVLLVLLFHIEFNVAKGGFVGVDVFFVISGYLIIGHIVGDMREGRWSVVEFYSRRIRRLVAPLIVMLLTSFIVGLFYLLPSELIGMMKSAGFAAMGVSNFYFLMTSGYFDAPSRQQAFLHTWSLGVEEQFYIIIPVVLWVILRPKKSRAALYLIALTVISLIYSIWQVDHDQNTAFYFVAARAWELSAGGLVALLPSSLKISNWQAGIAALIGLSSILIPAALYTEETLFPGVSAIPPVLGAAILIAAGKVQPQNLISRALGGRFFTYIGLASYSIYIWHWPLLVGQKFGFLNLAYYPARIAKLMTLGMALVLGFASWFGIERPIRKFKPGASARNVISIGLVAIAGIVALSLVTIHAGGFPSRLSERSLKIAAHLSYGGHPELFRTGTCFIEDRPDQHFEPQKCLEYVDPARTILLVGDSHAAHLLHGLHRTAPGIEIVQATGSRCAPSVAQVNTFPSCASMMNYVLKRWLPEHRVSRVLIASSSWDESHAKSMRDTVRHVTSLGIPVTVIGQIPTYTEPLPRILAFAGEPKAKLPEGYLLDQHAADVELQKIAEISPLVSTISLTKLLCAQSGNCLLWAGPEVPLQSDRSHLTPAGSILVAGRIVPLF